jgi:SAM-dependent methyltransferase
MDMKDYIQKNKVAWDEKTIHHYGSEFYDVPGFLQGKNSLNEIELSLLGNVAGKSILHLQCHFGQDTISLGRMGAKVTGTDLSENAIAKARELSTLANIPATFICCNIYDLPKYLTGQFDIVFSSYGTIMWLPDLEKWAGLIAQYLKPGGQFIFAEFHPVIWIRAAPSLKMNRELMRIKTQPYLLKQLPGTMDWQKYWGTWSITALNSFRCGSMIIHHMIVSSIRLNMNRENSG